MTLIVMAEVAFFTGVVAVIAIAIATGKHKQAGALLTQLRHSNRLLKSTREKLAVSTAGLAELQRERVDLLARIDDLEPKANFTGNLLAEFSETSQLPAVRSLRPIILAIDTAAKDNKAPAAVAREMISNVATLMGADAPKSKATSAAPIPWDDNKAGRAK